MTTLPDFRLETHFSKWEFKARHHMTASDAERYDQNSRLGGAVFAGNASVSRAMILACGLDHSAGLVSIAASSSDERFTR